jgi:predicted phosphoribosyltransferase
MYKNRLAAGQILADQLAARQLGDVCLLAVPRGGVVVAAPVAARLNVPLDVLVSRKIGHPANPEVAIGAVMPDGSAVLDEELISRSHVAPQYVERAVSQESAEISRRLIAYTGSDAPPAVTGKTAIVIDDGIATGYTIRAAVKWLRTLQPAAIIVAVPVAPPEAVAELARTVDEVLCPLQPAWFMAVGAHYQDFSQNSDEEVVDILKEINKVGQ